MTLFFTNESYEYYLEFLKIDLTDLRLVFLFDIESIAGINYFNKNFGVSQMGNPGGINLDKLF
jgi:hypothetical protein